MDHVPKLGVEVVAGAVPTSLVERGPEGFDVESDAVARRDCLAHIVSHQAIRKVELVVQPGLGSVFKRLGCQTKAGERPEIIGFDPVHDPRAHFLRCGCGSVVHYPWSVGGQRETGFVGDGISHLRVA